LLTEARINHIWVMILVVPYPQKLKLTVKQAKNGLFAGRKAMLIPC